MSSSKIVNGFTVPVSTKINQYSWYGVLFYEGRFRCGGSFIGRKAFMTAAHCLEGITDPTKIEIKFQNYELYGSGQMIRGEKIYIHPKYDSVTFDYDVGILCLEKRPRNIKSIRLVSSQKRTNFGKKLSVVGYGNFSDGGVSSNLPRQIDIKVTTTENYSPSEITPTMFPAADFNDPFNPYDNEDSCQGDSGSPAFAYNRKRNIYKAAGIVSWGVGCALDGYPGIYSKVSSYKKWIRSVRKLC